MLLTYFNDIYHMLLFSACIYAFNNIPGWIERFIRRICIKGGVFRNEVIGDQSREDIGDKVCQRTEFE